MKNNVRKIASGLMGVTMLAGGNIGVADEAVIETAAAEAAVKVAEAQVNGEFGFEQDVLSPSDDVVNLYGTAVTGVCATPAFCFEEGKNAEFFINVAGKMEHAYTITAEDMKNKSKTSTMVCSCGMGESIVQAAVSGIPVKDVLELGKLAEDAKSVTFTASDGYKVSVPLSVALDEQAMIVYKINGEELAANQRTQVWLPGAAANYFARDVVEIEVSDEEAEAPKTAGTKVALKNSAENVSVKAGDTIRFEGYADDRGSAIAAVEFSLDGGKNWTAYQTKNATADRWVYWHIDYVPEQAGEYELLVRARTADGEVSPLASAMSFTVAL